MEETKGCLDCGRELIGRSDKKFCSDSCRSSYNNRMASDGEKFIRKLNSLLRKNRSILLRFNPDGKNTTHRDKLLKAGFNFDYFTSTYITKDKREYRFCYEQGYLHLEDGFVLLVSRAPEEV